MGRRVLVLACVRTVTTFLLGFALGGIFNLLLTTTLHLSSFTSAPLWGTGREDVLRAVTQLAEGTREAGQQITSIPPPPLPHRGAFGEAPRVLCYVLVGPSTHKAARHVKNTWGQRCDTLVFYSTENDESLKPEVLDVSEGYGYLWGKNKEALTHLYTHYPHFHWYLKADDDTYVIVENLRYFLQGRDPDVPVYHGVKFRRFVKQGYMSGGGGYVLSREALRRFVTQALTLTDQTQCPTESQKGSEDLQLGQCLESVGVSAGESLDDTGHSRFFSHSPLTLFFQQPIINKLHWYWHYIWHPHAVGPDCCSHHTISFHGIDPRMMWVLETLLYRIHIHRDLQPPALNTSTSTPPPPSTPSTHTTHSTSTSPPTSSHNTTPLKSHPKK